MHSLRLSVSLSLSLYLSLSRPEPPGVYPPSMEKEAQPHDDVSDYMSVLCGAYKLHPPAFRNCSAHDVWRR